MHLQHGRGIWSGSDPGVVPLEGFDEGLADAIALGASHRGEAGNEAKCDGELPCFSRGVSGTVVSEPLNRMRRPGSGEPLLDTSEHQIAHHFTVDTGGGGVPRDGSVPEARLARLSSAVIRR